MGTLARSRVRRNEERERPIARPQLLFDAAPSQRARVAPARTRTQAHTLQVANRTPLAPGGFAKGGSLFLNLMPLSNLPWVAALLARPGIQALVGGPGDDKYDLPEDHLVR